jgi:pimeloyl-ACP methyl ester carboxylesterase
VKKIALLIACTNVCAIVSANMAFAQQSAAPPKRTTSAPAASTRPAPRRTESLEGQWSGVLQVGETQLHLVLHLSKEAQGEWHAAIDSLGQAVYGMEASNVALSDDTLQFEIDSVGAKFQGKVLPDKKTIRGLWEQGGTGLPLRFEKRAASADAQPAAKTISKVEGTWQGAIETGNMRMRLQLHVSHDDKGQLIAAIDSLDQGIHGIPASKVAEQAGELKLELLTFGAEYTGTLSAAKNEITGHWSQNGNLERLDFRRSEKVLELRRPQNPAKPYPYKEEEVSFSAADGKGTLAGTLTLPQGAGPFPAALLIAGSASQDRDATIAGHKPFLVLADFLTKHGLAVLRCDKRNSVQSAGNKASMETFTQDAQAALQYLKSRKEVDAKRVGVIGHSEGGIVGSLVSTPSNDVDWIVLLATPATTGERMLLRQSELIARTGGLSEEQISRSLEFDRKAYAVVRTEKDAEAIERKLAALVEQSGLRAAMPEAALQAQFRTMSSPWFREFLDYDPAPALANLRCPVLALSGDRDLQVDSTESVPLLRKTYESSGNKDFTVVEIEGVNHLFQKAQSGSPALYGAIEETIAPEVLTAVGNWITKHTAQ